MFKRKAEGDPSTPISIDSPEEAGPSDQKRIRTEDVKPSVEVSDSDKSVADLLIAILKKHGGPMGKFDYRRQFKKARGHELPLNQAMIEYIQQDKQFRYAYQTEMWNYNPKSDVPEITDLLSYLRTHSMKPGGIPVKDLKVQPNYLTSLSEWEQDGKILIMRQPGKAPLAKLGMKADEQRRFKGETVGELEMMTTENKGKYWKSVHWDVWRERGDCPVGKLDYEFTSMWAKVDTPPDADVVKMLTQLGHNSQQPVAAPARVSRAASEKKKKRANNRTVKMTNTHLKAFGIDLSQDYTPE